MTDLQGRNVIYPMKQLFEPITQFPNSCSMYKLKILKTDSIITNNDQVVNAETAVSSEDDEKIIAQQEKLLSNLYQLQKEVSEFQSKLNELKSRNVQKTDCLSLFSTAEIREFVINADPNYPPYALFWLSKLWDLSMNVSIHLHSSMDTIPKNLFIFDELKSDRKNSKYPTMTFVWKEVGKDTQLIVSPMKYTTVLGEVNILRFFEYILNPNEDTLQQIRKNEILDLAHRLNHVSSRDQQSILAQLQKQLSNENKWFCSNPSIADAAVWSALAKLKKSAIPADLSKYMNSCSEFIGVKLSS